MKGNNAAAMLREGKKILGTFFHSGSGLIMDAVGLSGLDFVIIDEEHSPIAVETAVDLIRAAEAHDMTAFVRIKEISRSSVLKLLDSGAKALIVPAVGGIADVKKLIEYSKYLPVGNRGMAMGRGADFGLNTLPLQEHWEYMNRETLLLPMCETLGFLEHVEDIVAMDGVDGIFVGPCDLSIALGKPGDLEDQEVRNAFRRVVDACKSKGKFSLIYAPNAELGKIFSDMGFDGLANGIDVNMMLSSYLSMSKQFKAIL